MVHHLSKCCVPGTVLDSGDKKTKTPEPNYKEQSHAFHMHPDGSNFKYVQGFRLK